MSRRQYEVDITPNGSSQKTSTTPTTRRSLPTDKNNLFNSPFLPTSLEATLLALYPTTLLLGSLFATLAPHIKNTPATYNPISQSYDPPSLAPSYFAQKKNIFNVYFVKNGWFWVTLALGVFIATNPFYGFMGRRADAKTANRGTRRAINAVTRWGIATLAWFFVTQWFFGPGLVDRSFVLTGGVCQALTDPEVQEKMSEPLVALSHAACKKLGGQWRGGHDISGHVFLLCLGSALLWMEILPVVLHARGLRQDRIVTRADGRVSDAGSLVNIEDDLKEGHDIGTALKEKCQDQKDEDLVTGLGVKFVLGVVTLSWWMLLMTAAFFHTWFEKTTGLIVAFGTLWLMYFAPRGVPALRKVVGMPGL